MKKIFIHKADSFKEAEEWEDRFYAHLNPEERLSDIQVCREQYFLIRGINLNESRKRLRRILKVIKQK